MATYQRESGRKSNLVSKKCLDIHAIKTEYADPCCNRTPGVDNDSTAPLPRVVYSIKFPTGADPNPGSVGWLVQVLVFKVPSTGLPVN